MRHSCKSRKRTETACDIHFCLWLLYLECFIDIKIASNNIRDGLDEMCVTVWAITFLSYGRDLVLLAVINVDLKVGSVVDFLIGCLRLVCSLINSPQTCPPFHIKWKVWINTKCRLNGCTPQISHLSDKVILSLKNTELSLNLQRVQEKNPHKFNPTKHGPYKRCIRISKVPSLTARSLFPASGWVWRRGKE